MTKADIELFTQGVPSFKKLSLLRRLGQVPIWGFCSALGSPTTALTLGCHCGDMAFLLASNLWNGTLSSSGFHLLKS